MPANHVEREYEYKPGLGIILLPIIFGLGAVLLGAAARSMGWVLTINDVIVLSHGATVILLFCIGGVFLLGGGFLLAHRMIYRQKIAFTEDALIAPRSRWSSEKQRIAYSAITRLSTVEAAGQHILQITHSGGQLELVPSMLPSRDAFEEIVDLLTSRTQAASPG